MIIKAQGKVFGFNLNNIGRGKWVVELLTVDGDPAGSCYSDPLPNEREARADARRFAANCYHDRQWGWCERPVTPE
jgi:hypothetical protein